MDANELLKRYAAGERDFRGADLSEADLTGADLSNSDLRGANLWQAELSCTNLKNTKLHEANLNYVNLNGADLSDADLSDAKLWWANLCDPDPNANQPTNYRFIFDAEIIELANLEIANLNGVNLNGADLSCAKLCGVNLSDVNLRAANLSNADLRYSNLSRADLRDANLSRANLRDANLIEATLIRADLKEANLINADLRYTNREGANLHNANLDGAKMFINPTDIRCHWEQLDDEQFEELCYDVLNCKYQPITIQKMGKVRSRDGGRDIVFQTPAFQTPLITHKHSVKWIAQCKLIRDGSSLTARKVNNITDIVAQYRAGGFCVMTSGLIDSTLHDRLDDIARNKGIKIDSWCRLKLERFLAQHPELRYRYFK